MTKYLQVGLDVGQLAPEFKLMHGLSELSLKNIVKQGPLVLVVELNNHMNDIEHFNIVEAINNQGGNYLKIIEEKNTLQNDLPKTYNENSTSIYIIDRKKLICYKVEGNKYLLINELENILSILKIMT